MIKNQQAPKGPQVSDGSWLNVHSIFPTIQGEGPFTGCPAIFIRLADCNLQCPLCDTDYTGGIGDVHVDALVERVIDSIGSNVTRLVVITGGEPFRQNLFPLVNSLRFMEYQIQIETNGRLPIQDHDRLLWAWYDGLLSVVVSPKTASLNSKIGEFCPTYKYVISARNVAEDGFPATALEHPLPAGKKLARPPHRSKVYINPADEKDEKLNSLNADAAVACVLRNSCRYDILLGSQLHKMVDLP